MASSRGLSPRVNRLFNLHLGHSSLSPAWQGFFFLPWQGLFFLPLQGNLIARSWLSTFWRFLAKLSHRRRPDSVYLGNPSRKNWKRPI